ncbi:alpha/beta hydrolase [Streptomyces sp. TRM49041]|uniref:alpha/beta hydrolase n=1 Tax=Streptomyces sp. TRM49041 TaxID=2603216 RepID=UPI0011EF37F3|nr:alpha/beta hydrolase [Streptomyces sp. TRM49041]
MMQPGMSEFVAEFEQHIPGDFHTRPIAEQRRLYRSLPGIFRYERPAGVTVRDSVVPGRDAAVPVRIYTPPRAEPGVLCYVRGDGFGLGTLDTHDTIAAELADKTGHVTVFADVRGAPEHKFPAALHDLRAVLGAAASDPGSFGAAPGPLGVVGDSSGGNLAVANCLMARDEGGPDIACHGLVSPVLDLSRWVKGGTDAPILSAGEMAYLAENYVADLDDLLDPLVSPLRATDFAGLPPATILATELDSLRDDAVTYARHLAEAGVLVTLTVEPGLVHAPLRSRGMCTAAARAWSGFCTSLAHLMERTGS